MTHRASDDQNTVTDIIAWLTPDRRRKLYVVLTLIAPLLVGYGVIEEQQAALWLSLASAVLVGGIAALHTPKAAPLVVWGGQTEGEAYIPLANEHSKNLRE